MQTKLEVGPSHDRFEAEADRIAASVVSHAGPSTPPAISPLTPGGASQRAVQREEKRSIDQREKTPDLKSRKLDELIQAKPQPGQKREEEKLQTKREPVRKPREGRLQTKRQPQLPGKREEDEPAPKLAQKKTAHGVVQRDSVDEDTVLETTIQAKREAAQRATATADTAVEQDEQKSAPAKVQREASSHDGFTASRGVESGISALRGRGMPLGSDLRQELEPRFGRDLSGVRVHDGAAAAKLSRDVHARAFTIGQDIFFGAGQYQPASSEGRALLAHEVTHTIQQGGGSSRAQPSRIQRDPPGPASGATTGTPAPAGAGGGSAAPATPPQPIFTHTAGELRVEGTDHILRFNTLPVPKLGGVWKGTGANASPATGRPAIRETGTEPWRYGGKTPRGSLTARQAWLQRIGPTASGISTKIQQKADAAPSGVSRGGQPIVYLKSNITSGPGQNFLLIGTVNELTATDEVRLPVWNRSGRGTLFDVDHIQELQLGGMDGFPNFWLLEQGTNRSSGSNIAREMKNDFNAVVQAADTAGYFTTHSVAKPNWDNVRTGAETLWQVQYVGLREVAVSGEAANWTETDVTTGVHLDQLSALTPAEILQRGLQYAANPSQVTATIFALSTGRGGFYRRVNFSNPNNVVATDSLPTGAVGSGAATSGQANQFYRGLAVGAGGFTMTMAPQAAGATGPARPLLGTATSLTPGQVIANIHGQPFPSSGKITAPAIDIPIIWQPEFGFGGYTGRSWVNELMGRLSIEGMSPLQVFEAGISPAGEMFANGEIQATKALFPDLRVPIFLRGNEIGIRFPIPTDKLNFGPVHVTEAAIEVGFGDRGIFLAGTAGLTIDHVGSGTVTARATREDTIIEGEFNFDLDFLDPAQARIRYSLANDTLSLTLNAGVKSGVLPGVTSGRVTASFSREAIDISGTLNLAPPLNGSTITVAYTETEGLTIAAENIPLPVSNIPGVQDASLSARANYNTDDGGWHLAGEGRANFSVPPATGTLTVGLDGRVVTIQGIASFQQGIAAGSVDVTATNAQLDEAGQPVPGQVAERFTVFGSGQASLTFGILTGTAALELTRDGHVIITGTIALPPSHTVFERSDYRRELLHVEPPEFPIWGFSLGGIGVGVFAFVDARLSADAFVGPGTLQDTQVGVTFDLEHPEEAVVDGTAAFVVPAGAGMTLDIGGGLRARAAVAYVQGRVGLDARLGLQAEARADVSLHWSREEGLSLTASAHAEASPQFEVGANASVTAGVDLGLFDISETWGPWRRVLGSFGPELAVGVTMPIAWSERNGLDFSADNVELTYPDIDFGALMTDGFMQLV
ncbi:MAG: eCIS core domain-containing protein [Croceibacterium sp.]